MLVDFDETVVQLKRLQQSNDIKKDQEINEKQKKQFKNWIEIFKLESEQELAKGNVLEILNDKYLRITIILWLFYLLFTLATYGISFTLPFTLDNESNTNFNFIEIGICEVAELSGGVLSYFLIEDSGRKYTLIISLLAASLVVGASYFLRLFWFVLMIFLWKFISSVSWDFIGTYAPELYDTNTRSTGVGYKNAWGCFGSVIMPLVVFTSLNISAYFPYLIFSGLILVSGLLVIFLPYDTVGMDLDTPQISQNGESRNKLNDSN